MNKWQLLDKTTDIFQWILIFILYFKVERSE